MAREHAQIRVRIWQDDDFRDLPPDAQHLYFVLLTAPLLSYCGVTDWRPKRIASQSAGWREELVMKAGYTLHDLRYLVIDEDTEEVLIRSFVRNDGLMKQPRMAVSMANAYAATASKSIRGVMIHELIRLHNDEPELSGWSKPQALALLDLPSINPNDLPKFGPGLGLKNQRFPPGLGEALPNVWGLPTPSPTPAPYSSSLLHTPEQFEEFYEHYPKKVAKDAAIKAFEKAIKRASFERILAGVIRFANDPNLPEKQFIPNPASWLNAGQWDDEPCPPRGRPPGAVSPASTTDAKVANTLALADRLRNLETLKEIAQ